jgi:hypothetical protein
LQKRTTEGVLLGQQLVGKVLGGKALRRGEDEGGVVGDELVEGELIRRRRGQSR